MKRLRRWLLVQPLTCLLRRLGFSRPTLPAVVKPTRSRPGIAQLEDRIVPDGRPLPLPFVFAGVGSGPPPLVRAYHADTGELAYERQPFDSGFAGGVRVAAGDVNHDGIPDLIAAAGPGGGPHVRVYDGVTGVQVAGNLGSFFAYDSGFSGGVFVASGDVDGDGWADVITAAGAGGGPHVKVFSGATGELIDSFMAYAPEFRGGASVAAADFNGDGRADVVVGAGAGGGPEVRVYDLTTHAVLPTAIGDFLPFDSSFSGGVDVGADFLAGDVTGDGVPDLVVGAGPGMESAVKVFDGADGSLVASFSPFGSSMTAGVRVAVAYVDDDARADVIVGTGEGAAGEVRVFGGADFAELAAPMSGYLPFGSTFAGGLFVGGSNDPVVVVTVPGDPPGGGASVVWITADHGATEGGGSGWFTVHRTGSGALTVNYSAPGGTATPGSGNDYTGVGTSGGTVSFTSTQTSATIDVNPVDDTTVEGTETVTLALAAGTGYTVSGGGGSVSLYDNDPSGGVSVWITGDHDATEGGASGGGYFTVHRSSSVGVLTVSYGTPSGTATAGTDYTAPGASGGTVTFANGESTKTVAVTPVDDSAVEGTETVTLALAGGGGYTVSGGGGSVSLYDNDPSGGVSVWITGDHDATEGGASGGGYFTVHRSSSNGNLSVMYSISGAATSGVDYAAPTGSIVFGNGETDKVVVITPNEDSEVEGTESVMLTVADGGGYTVDEGQAAISLFDNDSPSGSSIPVNVWITGERDGAELGEQEGQFTIHRNSGIGALTVKFVVTGGSAIEGQDFRSLDETGDTITFANGETALPIYITPVDDIVAEGTETVIVGVAGGGGYEVSGVAASISLYDNDQTGVGGDPVRVWISKQQDASEEGSVSGWFAVHRSNSNGSLTVGFSATSGTAINGTDYTGVEASGGTIAFTDGEIYSYIYVDPVDDSIAETKESVTVSIAAGSGYSLNTSQSATVYIEDNDPSPAQMDSVWISADQDAYERDQLQGWFTLHRTSHIGTLSVTYYTPAGTAALGVDYTGLSASGGTVLFQDGELEVRIYVYPLADSLVEPLESIVITLAPGDAYLPGTASTAQVNLRDDKQNEVSIDLDVNHNKSLNDPVDGIKNYLPGYEGKTQILTTEVEQTMIVIVSNLTINTPYKARLVDSSHYAGIAMNAESVATKYPSKGTDNDFVLVKDPGETSEEVVDTDNVDIAIMSNGVGKAFVTIRVRDFGGRTTVVIRDGTNSEVTRLAIPLDTDGNKVADVAPQNTGPLNTTDVDDDNDDSPGLNGDGGDRLTRFEEYRGFLSKGIHVRTSTKLKTLFVSNQTGWVPTDGKSAFTSLTQTGIQLVEVNDKEFDATTREINSFGRADIAGAKAQRAVVVENDDRLAYFGVATSALGAKNRRASSYKSVLVNTSFVTSEVTLAAKLEAGQRDWIAIYKDPNMISAIEEDTKTINAGPLTWAKGGRIRIGTEIIEYADSLESNTKLRFQASPEFKVTTRAATDGDDVIFVDTTKTDVRAVMAGGEVIKVTGSGGGTPQKLDSDMSTDDAATISIKSPNFPAPVDNKKMYLKIGDEWLSFTGVEETSTGVWKLKGVTRKEFSTQKAEHHKDDDILFPFQLYGLDRGYKGSPKNMELGLNSVLTVVTLLTGLTRGVDKSTDVVHIAGTTFQAFLNPDQVLRGVIAHEVTHTIGHVGHVEKSIMASEWGRGQYEGGIGQAELFLKLANESKAKLDAK